MPIFNPSHNECDENRYDRKKEKNQKKKITSNKFKCMIVMLS